MSIRDIIRINQIIDKKINLGLKVDKNIYKEFESQSKSYNTAFSFGIDLIHEFLSSKENFYQKNFLKTFINLLIKIKKLKTLELNWQIKVVYYSYARFYYCKIQSCMCSRFVQIFLSFF